MPRNGLTKEIIINKSIELIENNKFSNFSIRELAKKLDVKPSSLYNHIKGMDELLAEICHLSILKLNNYQFKAIENVKGDDAFWKLASAYKLFVKTHPELYNVIINIYKVQTNKDLINALEITAPFIQILDNYPLSKAEKAHWQRIFRAILHGFVSQEEAGYFSHFNINEDETFKLAIKCYIDGLHNFINHKEGKNNE